MVRVNVTYFSGEIPQGDPEGDQRDIFRRFQLFSKDKNYPVLNSFLDSVTSALKDEVRKLGRTQRGLMPYFERVTDLTDHVVELRKTSLGGAVERVMVIVMQLGTFISYYEAHPDEYDFKSGKACILSRGTGLLSSAAVGLSPRLGDIPRVAEDVTRIAFRFGLVVDEVSRTLESSPAEINATGPWIQCCYGLGEKEAVDEVARFNEEMNYPETTKATVFNVDAKSVSVSGPPSTIKTLFSQSPLFKNVRSVPLQKIQGCWHAEHIYGPEHVQYMIPDECVEDRQLQFPVFSPVTGEPFKVDAATTIKDFFQQLMEEIMMKRVYWDKAVARALNHLKSLSTTSVNMILLRPSYYITEIVEDWKAEIPGLTVSTTETIPWVMDHAIESRQPRDHMSGKLAVVGMSCRFPDGADSNEKFWELLEQGRDAHRTVPSDRFDVETHVDPEGKKPNTSRTPYGCFINEPGLFDAPFFNMSPREAEQTDPMHRLALVTAYEALEQAGFVQGRGGVHKRKIGTFYGQASDDYREANSGQDIGTYFIPGGCRAFAPGRINYFFDFWGPSFSIDTACSSSLAAIQQACTSLWSGDSDMVIAGGLNVMTNSDVSAGLSKGHFLSKTGGCKTWDIGADGYCRADGVGSVVIKRLEDAQADNDNIMAVVLAAATNHSAEAVSITHPHDAAQSSLFTQVARRAGIDPLDVGYVEMHGTGTQAGDKTEVKSVTDVFAPSSSSHSRGRDPDNPLYIGTVKSNLGHGEAAAGIMSFIKACLIFQKSSIPPHIGVKTKINPSLPELASRNVIIPFEKTPWPRHSSSSPSSKQTLPPPRIMVINNFGAAGGNTTVILEDAPPHPPPSTTSSSVLNPRHRRTFHILPLSAKNPDSLQMQIENLVDYLTSKSRITTPEEEDSSSLLENLSYTLSARRNHYSPFRVAVGVTSIEEARRELASLRLLENPPPPPPPSGLVGDQAVVVSSGGKGKGKGKKGIILVFTGQGGASYLLGIGKELYRDCEFFRRKLVQLDGLARRQGFCSSSSSSSSRGGFLGLVVGDDDGGSLGGKEKGKTTTTEMHHLAIVCVEIALAKLWEEEYGLGRGGKIAGVVGHSLGEYAALVTAGVLSESGCIFLVGMRARLLDGRCGGGSQEEEEEQEEEKSHGRGNNKKKTHGMMAVKASVGEIEDLSRLNNNGGGGSEGLRYQVACINSPGDTVLAGPMEELDAISDVLNKAGKKTYRLDGIPHAYHSDQMNAVVDEFVEQARGVVFKAPRIPVISPLHAKVFDDNEDGIIDAHYLAQATRHTVNFVGALDAALEAGLVEQSTCWLEVGPHPICSRFVQNWLPTIASSKAAVLPSLRKGENNWTTMAQTMCSLYKLGFDLDWDAFHKPFERDGTLRLLSDLPSYAWNNRKYWIQYRGDWNLTKGRDEVTPTASDSIKSIGGFRSRSIHAITSEDFSESQVTLEAEVDVNSPVLREVVDGHAMNGYGCVSSFMHADMAFTLAKYIHDKLRGTTNNDEDVISRINISDFEYHEPVVRVQTTEEENNSNAHIKQIIQISCSYDIKTGKGQIKWYNPSKDLWYAHASFSHDDHDPSTQIWEWSRRYTHLLQPRIETLRRMADSGTASKITRDLAYNLFGNLVRYGEIYQNMQTVILDDFEAMAEVVFPPANSENPNPNNKEKWTVPPHFIDGVTSLSGFILNGGTCVDNRTQFYVTPSWRSMRFSRPLVPEKKYISYVRMLPSSSSSSPNNNNNNNTYSGDVYVLDAATGEIIGMVEEILFRGWPRVLLNRFFSPPPPPPPAALNTTTTVPSLKKKKEEENDIIAPKPATVPLPLPLFPPSTTSISSSTSTPTPTPFSSSSSSSPSPPPENNNNNNNKITPLAAAALSIIAQETGLSPPSSASSSTTMNMMNDDSTEIAELGLDSLMSLVIAQRLREELGLEMRDSFFLEVSTVGELKGMLLLSSSSSSAGGGGVAE